MGEKEAWDLLKRSDCILEAQLGSFYCREFDRDKITKEEWKAIDYLCDEWDCSFELVKVNP